MATTTTATGHIDAARRMSVSGTLMDAAYPGWANHQECITEVEVVRRICDMMSRTPLDPRCIDPKRGPITQDGNIAGNFFHYSAGFHIDEPCTLSLVTIRRAWAAHRRMRQFRVVQLILRVAKRGDEAADAAGMLVPSGPSRFKARLEARQATSLRIRTLEPFSVGTPIPKYGQTEGEAHDCI